MLLSALLPLLQHDHSYYYKQYRPYTRDAGYVTIPSLLQLQRNIEEAWNAGYDPKGAEHYKHRLVGKKSQIGAVEVSYCLLFLRIDCCIVQFIRCPESRTQLGPFCVAYFTKQHHQACPCCDSAAEQRGSLVEVQQILHNLSLHQGNLPVAGSSLKSINCKCPTFPLYLQWKGHSVLVIGVERHETDDKVKNLLVFDPAKSGSKLKEALSERNDIKPFQLSLCNLEKKDIQIVVVSEKSLTIQEQERLKMQVAVVTAADTAVSRSL